MARDNNPPAYSAPDADQTGERTAENAGDGTVTEPQADQAKGTEQESGENKAAMRDAAREQAKADSDARHEAEQNGTFVHREANPDVGGEDFPSFAPER